MRRALVMVTVLAAATGATAVQGSPVFAAKDLPAIAASTSGVNAMVRGRAATLSETQTGSAVSGTITFSDSDPYRSVTATLETLNGDWAASAPVRADGTFNLGTVTPGSYRLQVQDHYGIFATTRGEPFRVAADQPTDIKMTVLAKGQIRLDTHGTWVFEQEVALIDSRGHRIVPAWNNGIEVDHTTWIRGLPAGTYRVEFDRENMPIQYYSATAAHGVSGTLAGATQITVKDGVIYQGQLTLQNGPKITGNVTAFGARPSTRSSVRVKVFTPQGKLLTQSPIRPDGTYTIGGMSPQSVVVGFVDDRGIYAARYFSGNVDFGRTYTLNTSLKLQQHFPTPLPAALRTGRPAALPTRTREGYRIIWKLAPGSVPATISGGRVTARRAGVVRLVATSAVSSRFDPLHYVYAVRAR